MMDSSTLDRLIAGEIEVVNGTLAAFGVDAGTRPAWTTVAGSSFIWYGLRLGRAQAVDGLTKRLTDIAARIGQYRRGFGLTGEWPVAVQWRGTMPRPWVESGCDVQALSGAPGVDRVAAGDCAPRGGWLAALLGGGRRENCRETRRRHRRGRQ